MTEKAIAIETSSREGSIALAEDGAMQAEITFATQAGHGRDLHVAIQQMIEARGWSPRDIQQCHVSIGPGSFTGLRVAVTFARSLALATGARIVAVPTLQAIAWNCLTMPSRPRRVAVMLHAKRGLVFGGVYELRGDTYVNVDPVRMAEPATLLLEARGLEAVMGEAVTQHHPMIDSSGLTVVDESLWLPRAAKVFEIGRRMAQAGQFTAPRELVPLYIRRPEAEEVWERQQRQ